jgi:hypothetical protein
MRFEQSRSRHPRRAFHHTASIACGLGLVLATSACTSSTHTSAHRLGDRQVLLTSADLRATMASGPRAGGSVVCAEPSPDLAKAVQSSFGAGGSVSADIPTQVSGSAAVSVARARAEAAAQLGERLATIQLLRDGLYRACEAYANGAIDEVFYSVMLGRYDDTMVTLLAGELAAGNFGRQLATIGGGSDSTASAQADLAGALTAVEDAEERVARADQALTEAEARLATAQARGDATANEAAAVADKKQEQQDRRNELVLAAENAAKATATATAATGIAKAADNDMASVVHAIQTTYINDRDFDSLMIACFTALTNPKPEYAALADLCTGRPGQTGLLQLAVRGATTPNSTGSPPATDALLVAAR